MNILSIDSSGPMLSIELKINNESYSYSDQQKSRASQIILSSIDKIMSDNNVEVTDLNMIVFNKGPASFTGTRVAASVCQGIGYSCNIPVIGVSSLSLMAFSYYSNSNHSQIVCIKKAYSDKFYVGKFDVNNNGYETVEAISLLNIDQLSFNKDNHYISDSWDKIISALGINTLNAVNYFNEDSSSNSEVLLKYAEKHCVFDQSFELEKTFPDYANHVIDI